MRTIGNILWLVFAGFWLALGYALGGLVLCLTIVGIPFGIQAFKLAGFALWPFGRRVEPIAGDQGCLTTVFNVLWLVLFGWEIFLASIVGGLARLDGRPVLVIGVLALWPFGRTIVED